MIRKVLIAVAATALLCTSAAATPTHNPGTSWRHLSTSSHHATPLLTTSTRSGGTDFCSSVTTAFTTSCDLIMKAPTIPLSLELSHLTKPLVVQIDYKLPVEVRPGTVLLPALFGSHWRDRLNFWDNAGQGMVSLVAAYIPKPLLTSLTLSVGTGSIFGTTNDLHYCSGVFGRGGCSDNFYTLSYSRVVNSVGVPEPATLAVLGAGLAWLGFRRRR